jgi:hypothetical protein
VKGNIWLFFLGVMVGIASSYAVAHYGFVRQRQRCSEGMLSIRREGSNTETRLRTERDLAQRAADYCMLHHGSMEGFGQDAASKQLEKEMSDIPTLREP